MVADVGVAPTKGDAAEAKGSEGASSSDAAALPGLAAAESASGDAAVPGPAAAEAGAPARSDSPAPIAPGSLARPRSGRASKLRLAVDAARRGSDSSVKIPPGEKIALAAAAALAAAPSAAEKKPRR